MKLHHLSIGQRLGLLATVLLLATLFIGIRGLTVNADGLTQNQHIMDTEQTIAESIDTARNAQVQFKIQVQEWKNILLRGTQGQEKFNQYRDAFVKQSQKTQALLDQLSKLLPEIGLSNSEVLKTRTLHAELGQHYLNALQQYNIKDSDSAHRVDGLVTGIDRIPTRMNEGNSLVKVAGSAIEEIVSSVQRVSQLVETISMASGEQSSGIDQVNVAVVHMDAATQQNATLSQASAAAAQAMQQQAEQLLEMVRVFKLREE